MTIASHRVIFVFGAAINAPFEPLFPWKILRVFAVSNIRASECDISENIPAVVSLLEARFTYDRLSKIPRNSARVRDALFQILGAAETLTDPRRIALAEEVTGV